MKGPPGRLRALLHDAQGVAFGVVMLSLGILFLKEATLVTGQLAGLAMLLSFATPLPFGVLFFAVNLPFYYLAWRRRGPGFTLRTLGVVAAISLLAPALDAWIHFAALPGILAALLAGCCGGVGLIALFRHGTSAGGLGILALHLEETRGIKAGWVQLAVDCAIFLGALFVLDLTRVALSLLSATVMNLLIGWNFRLRPVPPGER